jgi:lipoprotein-releasing system permease protein
VKRAFSSQRTALFIALKQLWERKLLNGIAVGGVTLGVLVLIAMNGIIKGFEDKFTQTILKVSPHVIVFDTELHPGAPLLERYAGTRVAARVAHERPSDRPSQIKRPYEIARAIEALPAVAAAAPSLTGIALLDFGGRTKAVDLRGIEGPAQERVTPIRRYVTAGHLEDLDTTTDAIALGSGLANDLGVRVGDTLHAASGAGTPTDLKVVAIFEVEVPPVDKARGYTTLRTAQALLGRPDTIGRIEVRLHDPEDAIAATDQIERIFGYDSESWKESNANFLAVFAMQDMIVSFVIGAILLVGGFGILAVQIMIVLQKQRDIAILRSVGLRRGDILRIFLLQGVTVAMVGGLVGALLGKVSLHYLAMIPVKAEGLIKMDTFVIHEERGIYALGIGFALFVGVVASLIPALRGSRVEPVEVLRGQIG